MSNHHNPACFAHHMGLYAISYDWAEQAKSMISMCGNDVLKNFNPKEAYQQMLNAEPIVERRDLYGITQSGIAVIPIVGLMTKGSSKFGTSTIDTRRALRSAVDDPKVKAIMLHLETPGGTTAGLDELANAITNAGAQKPLHAHADDLVASAGMWAASQAKRLTINRMGQAGSIGTYAILEDSSGAAEMQGLKFHKVATGEYKGMGATGLPITDKEIARVQSMVDTVQRFFSDAIMRGRGLSQAQVKELVSDGGVYFAKEAKAKGLVDGIESYEAALDKLAAKIPSNKGKYRDRNMKVLDMS